VKPAIPVSRRTFRCDPRLSCWTQVDVAFDDQRLVANAGLLLPAAQGVPGPARRSGRPAATWSGPRPSRSATTLEGAVLRWPDRSGWRSATAAAMPCGSAGAWWARRKECGAGDGPRRGVGDPGSSSGRLQPTTPLKATGSSTLNTTNSQLLANTCSSRPAA
jgi:hypothetical protein